MLSDLESVRLSTVSFQKFTVRTSRIIILIKLFGNSGLRCHVIPCVSSQSRHEASIGSMHDKLQETSHGLSTKLFQLHIASTVRLYWFFNINTSPSADEASLDAEALTTNETTISSASNRESGRSE